MAEDGNLNLSRVLDSVTPGPGRRRLTDVGWQVLLHSRGPGGEGSGFRLWSRALALFSLFSQLKATVPCVKRRSYSTAWVTDPSRCSCAYTYPGHPFRQSVSRILGKLHSPVKTMTVARATKSDNTFDGCTCRPRQNHVVFWML